MVPQSDEEVIITSRVDQLITYMKWSHRQVLKRIADSQVLAEVEEFDLSSRLSSPETLAA